MPLLFAGTLRSSSVVATGICSQKDDSEADSIKEMATDGVVV